MSAVEQDLVEVRIPLPNRPESLAEVTALVSHLHLPLFDLDISHAVSGDHGALVITTSAPSAPTLLESLADQGYEPSIHPPCVTHWRASKPSDGAPKPGL